MAFIVPSLAMMSIIQNSYGNISAGPVRRPDAMMLDLSPCFLTPCFLFSAWQKSVSQSA
jgi:hypothetical protein